ncbi:hypothetical protein EDB85DRAFT_1886119 [Lactarius pseudohatsudake]|nr:hypothetical protein EDB85DRAFT_1886119 [Lactarius pseudohatsudake]
MPATRRGTGKQRDKRSDDPNREIYIQETIEKVRSGEYASFRAAARSTKSDKEEAERHEREHAAAERDKKKAEDAEHARRIADDALNRVFTGRLGTYKKDDLRALAIAVAVSDKGTNAELLARIEDQFEQYRDLKYNSRFSGILNKSIRAAAQRKGSMVSSNEGRREEEVGALGNPDHLPSAVVTSDSRPPHLRPAIESSSSQQFPPKYHVHRYPPGDTSRSYLVTPVLHAHPVSTIVPNVYIIPCALTPYILYPTLAIERAAGRAWDWPHFAAWFWFYDVDSDIPSVSTRGPTVRSIDRTATMGILRFPSLLEVNASDHIGRVPLHVAACNRHLELVRLLLKHGGNVNARGHGMTPLDEAKAEVAS